MCRLCHQSWMRAGAGAGHGRGSAADTVMKEKGSPTIITGGWAVEGGCFPGPGKCHGQRNRMGYSPWGCKELDWATNTHTASVQLLRHVRLFVTPWTGAHQASLSITNSWSPPKPTSIESMMPSNHFILCHPLLLLPSIFPSIRVFSNESALPMRWPKYWSFSLSIIPSNEHPGLISFRMDWLDLLAVQGTCLLQHRSSNASILLHSGSFIV